MATLKLISSVIMVCSNPRSDSGMIAFHEITGIVPGARAHHNLTTMPSYMAVNVRKLHGYGTTASIHPDDWRIVIENSPVISSDLFPVAITPEVEAWARKEILSICNCPAVRSTKDVHPKYIAAQGWDNVDMRSK